MIKSKWMPVLFLAFVLLFGACNESVISEMPEDPVTVTFNVSTLNVDTQPMSRAATSGAELSEVVKKIRYYIYNSSNSQLIKYGSSTYDANDPDENFGVITESLTPGTYSIMFYAEGKGNGYCDFCNTEPFNYESYFKYKDMEVFYYAGTITVESTSTSFDVELPRKSGLLRINITDAVLSTVSKVEFSFSDSYRWYPKSDGSYNDSYTYQATITEGKLDVFDYYFSFPDALPSKDVKVKISVYDTSNNLLGEKSVTAPIYENKRTIVSGELFSTISDKNISVTINDVWGEDVDVEL